MTAIVSPLKVNPYRRHLIALVGLAVVLCMPSEGVAQIRAMDYDTLSYIEIESSELCVTEGTTSVTLNLYRRGEFRVTTKVDYTTIEGSAFEGQDFKACGGTIVFRPGEGFKSIRIDLLADDENEGDEAFEVKLSTTNPAAVISKDIAVITIQEPRPISAPVLRIAPGENGMIILSWADYPTAILERSLNAAAGRWEPVQCTVQTIGNTREVIVPALEGGLFYRLRDTH